MKESLIVRMKRWFTNGGGLHMIGRTFLIIGLIAAFVFASVGYVDMIDTRDAAEKTKYEENVKKQQERDYKKLVKDAEKAIKKGETPPEVPEDATKMPITVKPVEYDLSDFLAHYITYYILRAVCCIAAGVGLCWFFCHVQEMIATLKATAPRKIAANAVFWVGALTAIVIAAFGVVRIMSITKSTMGAVGEVLMKEYIVWSVAALGSGMSLRWLILNLNSLADSAFRYADADQPSIGKHVFKIAIVLFPFVLTGAIMLGIMVNWMLALIVAVADVLMLVIVWLIVAPRGENVRERQRQLRSTEAWICPECGKMLPASTGVCECGTVKPAQRYQ